VPLLWLSANKEIRDPYLYVFYVSVSPLGRSDRIDTLRLAISSCQLRTWTLSYDSRHDYSDSLFVRAATTRPGWVDAEMTRLLDACNMTYFMRAATHCLSRQVARTGVSSCCCLHSTCAAPSYKHREKTTLPRDVSR
jgi:hypothetical protein